jgi:predicted transposase/invertase (TIGR01784 family)
MRFLTKYVVTKRKKCCRIYNKNREIKMIDITPRVDIAFKKLFGVEENKDLLISLINSIVMEEDQVSDVDIMNPYNPRNFKKDKLSILDIKAKCRNGKRYNIEIQINDEADYDKRALYY